MFLLISVKFAAVFAQNKIYEKSKIASKMVATFVKRLLL